MDYSKVDDETKKLLGELIENIRTEFNRLIKIEYMGIDYNYGLMNFLLKNILAARDKRISELEKALLVVKNLADDLRCQCNWGYTCTAHTILRTIDAALAQQPEAG